jgi:hypothetical protein
MGAMFSGANSSSKQWGAAGAGAAQPAASVPSVPCDPPGPCPCGRCGSASSQEQSAAEDKAAPIPATADGKAAPIPAAGAGRAGSGIAVGELEAEFAWKSAFLELAQHGSNVLAGPLWRQVRDDRALVGALEAVLEQALRTLRGAEQERILAGLRQAVEEEDERWLVCLKTHLSSRMWGYNLEEEVIPILERKFPLCILRRLADSLEIACADLTTPQLVLKLLQAWQLRSIQNVATGSTGVIGFTGAAGPAPWGGGGPTGTAANLFAW